MRPIGGEKQSGRGPPRHLSQSDEEAIEEDGSPQEVDEAEDDHQRRESDAHGLEDDARQQQPRARRRQPREQKNQRGDVEGEGEDEHKEEIPRKRTPTAPMGHEGGLPLGDGGEVHLGKSEEASAEGHGVGHGHQEGGCAQSKGTEETGREGVGDEDVALRHGV